LTSTIGGTAVGIDFTLDNRFQMGLALGYTNATQYVDTFDSRSTSDGVYVGLYGSAREGGLYANALAGYARYSDNMRRTIAFTGLTPRTALGQTYTDQLFGQIEAGYQLPLFGGLSITPFAELQAQSANQAGLAETGANSIDLLVAPQQTNSLRSLLGGEIEGDWQQKTYIAQVRLAWAHEYIDNVRAITASFAGAPGIPMTVLGAHAAPDSLIASLNAIAALNRRTSLYLRYDAEFSPSNAVNNAFSAGLRITW
jgi:fibronectin-binding autotransporter adhesin